MSLSQHFYPQHNVPVEAAHSHWLVTDGQDVPSLDDFSALLSSYAQALEKPLPPGRANKHLAHWWVEPAYFARAIFALLAHFGYENCEQTVIEPSASGYKRFVLDTVAMNKVLGSDWPSWDSWVLTVLNSSARMREYCDLLQVATPDWFTILWEQGREVRQVFGYRLRPLPSQQGKTLFDKYVRALNTTPRLLGLADD
jgi:hypothetical protein